LKIMAEDEELREASRKASHRRFEKDRWREISIEEYLDFLEELQRFKGELNLPDSPHPRMQGENYTI